MRWRAETAADGTNVDAERQELRRAEMAEVMQLHALEPELIGQPTEGESRVAGTPRLREVDLVREQIRSG
jgi:hypothetical protein